MSNKKIVAFDLETIADESMVGILPEIKPKKNLTDPLKIEKDIAEKKRKQIAEMGLDPLTNIICCAGWCDENGPNHIMLKDEKSEKDLLQAFWEVLSNYTHFVTFNGRAFDVRCLLLHGMSHGVRPSVNIEKGKYNRGNHIDLRLILSGNEPFAKGKLDFYAKKYLDSKKTEDIDGVMVQDYWDLKLYDDIGKYCENDAVLTYQLFKRAETAGLLE